MLKLDLKKLRLIYKVSTEESVRHLIKDLIMDNLSCDCSYKLWRKRDSDECLNCGDSKENKFDEFLGNSEFK